LDATLAVGSWELEVDYDLGHVDIRQLQYLVALAREKHFTVRL
jgi:hypothetical protein